MALVQGQYNCARQEFLYVHVQDGVCSREIRCRSVKGISHGSDGTLCLVRFRQTKSDT